MGMRPPNAGIGRPKGVPNKATTSIKNAFVEAFEKMGGAASLAAWGQANPTEFYKLASKLMPTEVTGSLAVVDMRADEVGDDELARIAAGGSARATAQARGEEEFGGVRH